MATLESSRADPRSETFPEPRHAVAADPPVAAAAALADRLTAETLMALSHALGLAGAAVVVPTVSRREANIVAEFLARRGLVSEIVALAE